ncbi:MAG: hypothetical protein AAGH67_14700 [Cyanobacteria bacterium P01_H01_bin.162]
MFGQTMRRVRWAIAIALSGSGSQGGISHGQYREAFRQRERGGDSGQNLSHRT